MGDSDEENYATFGVPLDPLDEENIPRKKPITIEEQYAYDAQGRRRFHGAFTGGFSAGYFNTVGTRDGWRPQQFKSSRSSKADNVVQRPEDFMDEEDTSLFGIAPKGIRATSDYADHGEKGKKRERISQEGPIPGTPILKELLRQVKETVGIVLLKKMGWKPGQGVGSRLTKKEKQKIKLRNEKLKLAQDNPEITGSNSEDSDDDPTNITFAPDDYEPFRCKPKDNYFGIGYSGLDRRKVLSSHINLFDNPAFCIQDKNKKLSIHGQAFGVGAFEADDEDIYEKEDMSSYDFALGPERKAKTKWSQDGPSSSQTDCLDNFTHAKERLESKKFFKPPELPKNFAPVHAIRKSRFYPPITTPVENQRREPLNATDRARILEDPDECSKKPQTSSSTSVASNIISKTLNLHGKQQTEERRKLETQQKTTSNSWLDKLNAQSFVKGGIVGSSKDDMNNLKKLEDFKESLSAQSSIDKSMENDFSDKGETKKLFLSDPDKQRRFEQYLIFSKNGEKDKFESIQPLSMTNWEREQEREEFEQATKLEQSNNYMADKFVHSADDTTDRVDPEKDVKEAVRLKMFGKLTRQRSEWKPTNIVCKRFNIPEPKVGCAPIATDKKSARFSVFDSLDWCSSSKFTKAVDTVKTQVEDIPLPSSKTEENFNETVPIGSNDIPSSIYQPLEPISEKFRIFEASYEKVFGKGIHNISSATTKDVEQNTGNNLKDETIQEIKEKEKTPEPVSVLKDQSEEKKDLFKAIFLSSSEDSDSETEDNVDNDAVKSILIGKDPKEINIQRNTSPPRGIFAKLDLDSLVTQPKHVNDESKTSNISEPSPPIIGESQNDLIDRNDVTNDKETAILPDMYGPVLPQRLLKQDSSATTTEADNTNQLFKPVFRSVVVSKTMEDSKLGGKWVERDKIKKSKKKHKHKEKDKYKSSKHKKKSKKEKRSKR
ncbi:G patch domain-containing protein 1 like protein [Trachymyrmex septentrionalis]|uniref:G patch domain-containing protein 1 like protein n=1 Tax=Trachymyrmex septentrionalis TaxID=34720 RepID=A0A195FHR6_9HYME|nr:PREDICTED: G patch domain-containing protein 1 homolog [Trachymyrmex septentrionalis]KYN39911.1 G patch domain-containing protein 1 like protein [Trachymyrmex septentrionalis]